MSGGGGTQTQQNGLPAFANPWAIALLQSAGRQVFPNYTIDPTDNHIIPGPMNPYPTGLNYQTAGFTGPQNEAFGLTESQTSGAGGLANIGAGYTAGTLAGGQGLQNYGSNVLAGQQGLGNYNNQVLSGQFLNPNSNPNLAAYAGQAGSVLANQYALGTAPSLMAQAIGAGGGGPGALAGNSGFGQQQAFNQFSLGQNLANQNANIYNSAYNTGIGQMESAAGNVAGQQENAFGTGVAQQENALGLLGNTQSSLYTPSNQLLGIGGLQQQQQQNILNTNQQNFAQQTNWPWQQLNNLGALFGTSIGSAGTSTTTQNK